MTVTNPSPGHRLGALLEAMADARLLELTHDAILIQELPEHTITFWSPSATQMYGWTAVDPQGHRTTVKLTNVRYNVAVPESAFTYAEPKKG